MGFGGQAGGPPQGLPGLWPLSSPLSLLVAQTMNTHGVKNLVFSSSATVYGNPHYLPLDENHPTGGCTNPYGKSKFFIEEMIRDLCQAEKVKTCYRWGI